MTTTTTMLTIETAGNAKRTMADTEQTWNYICRLSYAAEVTVVNAKGMLFKVECGNIHRSR
jgi:hypothetical protein